MIEIYRGKKVFITGHTGFKGSWLWAILNHIGAECTGYALAPHTEPAHFSLFPLRKASFIGDICNQESLTKRLQDSEAEVVFHLAAQPLVRESYKNPRYTYETNVIGTLCLLEAVRNTPSIKAVVIITTDKVYENKEWDYPYRESDELGGYDMYSSSKACAEILVNSYKRSFFSPERMLLIATARAGNVIGGGDWSTDRLIPDMVKATSKGKPVFIRNPKSVRPWQHVLDCLYGYLLLGGKLLEGKKEFARSWNFSPYSSETKNVKEITEIASKYWEQIRVEYGEATEDYHEAGLLRLDNSLATSLLKWKPVWDTETAIQKTIEWYKVFYQRNSLLTETQIAEFLQKAITK